jgi:hypothetical protein
MGTINYKEDNMLYAPGIATYSTKGKQGSKGVRGTSLFYSPVSISGDYSERNLINMKIKANEPLYMETQYEQSELIYIAGDLILDGDSNIFVIESNMEISNPIGNISTSMKIPNNETPNSNYEFDGIIEQYDGTTVITYDIELSISSYRKYKYIQIRNTKNGEIIIVKSTIFNNNEQ